MIHNDYLHIWLIPLNGLQDWTTYTGRPVGNIPEFMPLDNSRNREIIHPLRMNSVLRCYILDREETDEGEKEYVFQLLNTERNSPRTEAYMGFENGNTFFSKDHQICRPGVENVVNSLPCKWCCS